MVITVQCTSCWTAFPVDTNKVPPKGVSARCSVCGHVFRVERPHESGAATPARPSETVATPQAATVSDGPAPADGRSLSRDGEDAGRGTPGAAEGFGVEGALGTEAHAEPEAGPGMEPFAETAAVPEPEAAPEMEPFAETAAVSAPEAAPEMEPYSGMEAVSEEESAPEPDEGGIPEARSLPQVEEVPGVDTMPETDAAVPSGAHTGMETSAVTDASEHDAVSPDVPPEPETPPKGDVGLEAATPDDAWVFEREPDLDPSQVSYEPVGTLEEELAQFGQEADLEPRDSSIEVRETFEASVDFWARQETSWDGGGEAPPPDNGIAVRPEEPPPPQPTEQSPPPLIGAFTLGKRDPSDRARRLARVLVSDMIMYNPERHQRALAAGTLESDFEDEIAKSWKEYVEQVGRDVAESTDFWRSALNDVLAGGRQVF